jgi:hypothetical protein
MRVSVNKKSNITHRIIVFFELFSILERGDLPATLVPE